MTDPDSFGKPLRPKSAGKKSKSSSGSRKKKTSKKKAAKKGGPASKEEAKKKKSKKTVNHKARPAAAKTIPPAAEDTLNEQGSLLTPSVPKPSVATESPEMPTETTPTTETTEPKSVSPGSTNAGTGPATRISDESPADHGLETKDRFFFIALGAILVLLMTIPLLDDGQEIQQSGDIQTVVEREAVPLPPASPAPAEVSESTPPTLEEELPAADAAATLEVMEKAVIVEAVIEKEDKPEAAQERETVASEPAAPTETVVEVEIAQADVVAEETVQAVAVAPTQPLESAETAAADEVTEKAATAVAPMQAQTAESETIAAAALPTKTEEALIEPQAALQGESKEPAVGTLPVMEIGFSTEDLLTRIELDTLRSLFGSGGWLVKRSPVGDLRFQPGVAPLTKTELPSGGFSGRDVQALRALLSPVGWQVDQDAQGSLLLAHVASEQGVKIAEAGDDAGIEEQDSGIESLRAALSPHGWKVKTDSQGVLLIPGTVQKAIPQRMTAAEPGGMHGIDTGALRRLLAPHGWKIRSDQDGAALLIPLRSPETEP